MTSSISARETTFSARPVSRAADVHVLDESDLGRNAAAVLQQGATISSSLTPRTITESIFNGRKPTRAASCDCPRGPGPVGRTGSASAEAAGIERVERHGEPSEARLPQRLRLAGEQNPVGRHREVGQPGPSRRASERGGAVLSRRSGSPPVSRTSSTPRCVNASTRVRSPRTSGLPRGGARRNPAPACSTRTGGCNGPSRTRAGSSAGDRACRGPSWRL